MLICRLQQELQGFRKPNYFYIIKTTGLLTPEPVGTGGQGVALRATHLDLEI